MQDENGFKGVHRYWKKYENLLVLHILSTLSTPSIIDFGAGQTVYDNLEMLSSIQEAFSDKNFVFLILPYEDKEKSKKLLQKRMDQRNYQANKNKRLPLISRLTKRLRVDPHQKEVNDEFIESPSNTTLASHIVYTNNATPYEIAEAINAIYNGQPLPRSRVKIIRNPHRVKSKQFIPSIPSQEFISLLQSKDTLHADKPNHDLNQEHTHNQI